MTLLSNIATDDVRFVKQLDVLDHRIRFIRELAGVLLPAHAGFESVWSIANRVYDLHCSTRAGLLNRRSPDRTATALIA